jgi:hypothetical protein
MVQATIKGIPVTKLFSSSRNSFAITTLNSPEIRIDSNKDRKGPFTLAAAGTYDTGKQNSQGRFVVVGNSRWVKNSFLGFNGNRILFLSMMNWLSGGRAALARLDLSIVRPCEHFGRPLMASVAGSAGCKREQPCEKN